MQTPRPEFSPESPELGYFKMPPSRTRKASRWREDWEVLEELVRKCYFLRSFWLTAGTMDREKVHSAL